MGRPSLAPGAGRGQPPCAGPGGWVAAGGGSAAGRLSVAAASAVAEEPTASAAAIARVRRRIAAAHGRLMGRRRCWPLAPVSARVTTHAPSARERSAAATRPGSTTSTDALVVDRVADRRQGRGGPLRRRVARPRRRARHAGRASSAADDAGDHTVAEIGPGGPRILLVGHVDTVWPHGQIARCRSPRRDGRLYGPGTLDMKVGVAMGLLATRAVFETAAPATGRWRCW